MKYKLRDMPDGEVLALLRRGNNPSRDPEAELTKIKARKEKKGKK